MSCTGCELVHDQSVIKFTNNRHEIITMLIKHGIIDNSVVCTECNKESTLDEDQLIWRCQRKTTIKKNRKVFNKRCNFKQSLRKGSVLENTHLSPEQVCLFLSHFILLNPPHQTDLINRMGLSSATVVKWSGLVQQALEDWCVRTSAPQIGGPGKVVEIDEAKFGKRKYNRGRVLDGVWLFGCYERGSRSVFMEPVPDRTSSTFLRIIKRRIRPGTAIISDSWKAYNCLQDEGFEHLTVNHSMNFVDPESGAHTQHIERMWRDARHGIPKFGRQNQYKSGYIAVFLFRRSFPNPKDRVHHLLTAIKNYYDAA